MEQVRKKNRNKDLVDIALHRIGSLTKKIQLQKWYVLIAKKHILQGLKIHTMETTKN